MLKRINYPINFYEQTTFFKKEDCPKKIDIPLEDYINLHDDEKVAYLNTPSGDLFHMMLSQQVNHNILENIMDLADKIIDFTKSVYCRKGLAQVLNHVQFLNIFTQASTRTDLSFYYALTALGVQNRVINDLSVSSFSKGESLTDSFKIFSSYVDGILIRTEDHHLHHTVIYALNNSERPIPVINAGSGKEQHPTQALLDVYTMCRTFGRNLKGLKIAISGDITGRTVGSLCYQLQRFIGADFTIYFCSPPFQKISAKLKEWLEKYKIDVKFFDWNYFNDVIKDVDVLYHTRYQKEYKASEEQHEAYELYRNKYPEAFIVTPEHLNRMPEHAILLHPLPKTINDTSPLCETHPKFFPYKQALFGKFVRMALVLSIFQKESEIL